MRSSRALLLCVGFLRIGIHGNNASERLQISWLHYQTCSLGMSEIKLAALPDMLAGDERNIEMGKYTQDTHVHAHMHAHTHMHARTHARTTCTHANMFRLRLVTPCISVLFVSFLHAPWPWRTLSHFNIAVRTCALLFCCALETWAFRNTFLPSGLCFAVAWWI